MGDRGWLSGAGMHIEYHSERKKKKAANCIFQTRNRICKNEKSPCYLGKCFEATWCTYKIKEKMPSTKEHTKLPDVGDINKPVVDKYKGIKCSLPMGIEVFNKKKSRGKLIKYDKEKRIIYVKYLVKEELAKYKYPEAFLEGFLEVEEKYKKNVANDITSRK